MTILEQLRQPSRVATLLGGAAFAFAAMAQAPIGWHQTPASQMNDVAVDFDGHLYLAGENGTVWRSQDEGRTFEQIKASGFDRVTVSPGPYVYAVGKNGSLWRYSGGNWWQTPASDIADAGAAPGGRLWLVGRNGSVWFSTDRGKTFKRIEASGFCRISATDTVAWGVGCNGSLWKYAAGKWTRTQASGIGDAGVTAQGKLWLAGKNGTVWFYNGGGFNQVQASGFESVAANDKVLWGVGANGSLWYRR